MSKKILPFPLVMKNGAKVRTIEDLRKNADIESIMSHYMKGTLSRWCKAFHYDDIINETDNIKEQIIRKLYETLEIDVNEDELKQYLENNAISDEADVVDEVKEIEIIDSMEIKNKLKETDNSIDYSGYAVAVNMVESDENSKKYKLAVKDNQTQVSCQCFIKCDTDKALSEAIIMIIKKMSELVISEKPKAGKSSIKDFVFVEVNEYMPAFYICDHPVTQAEYQAIMGYNPSEFKGFNNPVEQVSWYNAVWYCNKRSEKEGLTPCYTGDGANIECDFKADGYRLPTEEEWAFAASGGNESNGYKYSGSDNIDEVAWYSENSDDKTHPVKKKKANELGLYDMSGNVWEWCWDGHAGSRAIRGGSWKNGCIEVSCSSSNDPNYEYGYPYFAYGILGFRVVRSV